MIDGETAAALHDRRAGVRARRPRRVPLDDPHAAPGRRHRDRHPRRRRARTQAPALPDRRREMVTAIAGVGACRNICRAEKRSRVARRERVVTRTFAQSLAWAADGAAHLRGMMLRMGDDAFAARSALPDWTRAHVLTHVARNADALGNLIEWARTGTPKPAYASRERATPTSRPGRSGHPPRSAPTSSPPPTGSPPSCGTRPRRRGRRRCRARRANRSRRGHPVVAGARGVDPRRRPRRRRVLRRPAAADAARAAHRCRGDVRRPPGLPPAAPPAVRRATHLGRRRGGGGGIEVRGPVAELAAWLLGRSKGRDLRTAEGKRPRQAAGLDLTPWSSSPTSPRSAPSSPCPSGSRRPCSRRRPPRRRTGPARDRTGSTRPTSSW